MEEFVVKNGVEMRKGYTTGSSATAAACGAAWMLLTETEIPEVDILLPSGEKAGFRLNNIDRKPDLVSCSVTKDGGDDPDATHGIEIFAQVEKIREGIEIDGGKGVGRVTVKGLQCAVGEAAINPTPRNMIKENLKRLSEKAGYTGGLKVIISVPEGEKVAKHTFNERLGIVGGISILGTTGIVDPMSEQALIDTIKAVVDRQKAIDPDNILIAPGNYGKDFCRDYLNLDIDRAVEISNFVGESLDYIRYKGFKNILFVGHTGKLIKTAAGIMNTHSRYADGRMEIIGVHSAMNGASPEKVKEIMKCITTDDAFDIIKDEEFYPAVKKEILEKSLFYLNYRLKGEVNIEVIMFTSDREHIIESSGVKALAKKFMEVEVE